MMVVFYSKDMVISTTAVSFFMQVRKMINLPKNKLFS